MDKIDRYILVGFLMISLFFMLLGGCTNHKVTPKDLKSIQDKHNHDKNLGHPNRYRS